MIILGIDPGSRLTGWGVIEKKGAQVRQVANGVIKAGTDALPNRLGRIYHGLVEHIEAYQPEVMAIEQVFLARNPDSAIKLGQARGAAIAAGMAKHLEVAEYTAKQIKQAVVGKGAAKKHQMQQMVSFLLKLETVPEVDAADALAVALCHGNTASTIARFQLQEKARNNYRIRQL